MRRPTPGFGTRLGKPSAKAKPLPAVRQIEYERRLCEAIRMLVRVELRYHDDMAFRLVEPTAVYESSPGQITLSGTQVVNPAQPSESLKPRNFEVGRIVALRLTDNRFVPDPRFDPRDPKYKLGILCSV